MRVRKADRDGRIHLGIQFAGATFVIDDIDPNRVIVTPMSAIPKRELRLYRSPQALASVRAGLLQSKSGNFSQSPPEEFDVES